MNATVNRHGAVFLDGTEAEHVIGWVRAHECENHNCITATEAGRPWHAIPMRGALDDYHFATRDDAIAALEAARKANR